VAAGPCPIASHHPNDAGCPRIGCLLLADVTKFGHSKLRPNLFTESLHSLYTIINIIIKNVCKIGSLASSAGSVRAAAETLLHSAIPYEVDENHEKEATH
jgi:hypothetical protein